MLWKPKSRHHGIVCLSLRPPRQLLCNNASTSICDLRRSLGTRRKPWPIPFNCDPHQVLQKAPGLASGIALAGAASGALVYGPLIEFLSTKFGMPTTFRILAGLQSLMLLSALTFVPVTMATGRNQASMRFDFSAFSNRFYVVWVAAQCTFMVVFLVPFVHLVSSFARLHTSLPVV